MAHLPPDSILARRERQRPLQGQGRDGREPLWRQRQEQARQQAQGPRRTLSGQGNGVWYGRAWWSGCGSRCFDSCEVWRHAPADSSAGTAQRMILTDEAYFYDSLKNMGYEHKRVNHSAQVYVSGMHTRIPLRVFGASPRMG